jgi:hypothetical protein
VNAAPPVAGGHINPTVAAATSSLPQECLEKAARIDASPAGGPFAPALK